LFFLVTLDTRQLHLGLPMFVRYSADAGTDSRAIRGIGLQAVCTE